MPPERLRRQFVVGCISGAAMLAGCRQPGQTGRSSRPAGESATTAEPRGQQTLTDRSTAEGTGSTGTPELDLREANVVAVEIESTGDGQYQFDVTLYHDDDGEDGYADWWQVETLDGEQLGRRELLHAHSTAPFTRSETIEIPDGTTCVVVRGHDQSHGYGGQAMVVAVESGVTRPVQQGSERARLADVTCPS